MDKYAKTSLDPDAKPCIRNKSMISHLPSQKISFRNEFFRLTRDTLHNLNIYQVGHNAERHIQRKRSLTNSHMKSIQWHDFDRVLMEASIKKKERNI